MHSLEKDHDTTRKRDPASRQEVAIEEGKGDSSWKETANTGAPSESKRMKVDPETATEIDRDILGSEGSSQV